MLWKLDLLPALVRSRLVLTYCLLGFCYALHVNYKNDVWQGSCGVGGGAQVSVPPGEAELN